MQSDREISRRDFLHGFLHPFSGNGKTSGDAPEDADAYSAEPDYLSLLPPEFSAEALKMEAVRLGANPAAMTQSDMAALVVRAMYGAAPLAARIQKSRGPVPEEQRTAAD